MPNCEVLLTMDDNLAKSRVSAREQRGVLIDVVNWLRQDGVLPSGTKVLLSDLDLKPNAVSIAPLKGVIRRKTYSCGGYEVQLPFGLWYRAAVDSNNGTDSAFQVLDNIGICLDDGTPPLELTGSRELLEAYQKTTAIKYKQAGAMCDFMAEFVLIYSRDD